MYGLRGLKASEVISELQKLINKHGDLIVATTDGEYGYPEGVQSVSFKEKNSEEHYDIDCFRI